MSTKVYLVMHSMGMDGDYVVAAFSKENDADKLCELYRHTEDYGDYDFYYKTEQIVDDTKIENYYINDGEDFDGSLGYRSLEYKEN